MQNTYKRLLNGEVVRIDAVTHFLVKDNQITVVNQPDCYPLSLEGLKAALIAVGESPENWS